MKKYLKELYKRKDLLRYLVLSGLKAQHRNTLLGYFWWLLDPLLGVFVYYFLVVIVLDRGGPDYPAFLVIGLVVFRWFRSTAGSSARSITGNANIITQVYLPKAIFPIAETFTQLINFLFGLVIMATFLLFYRIRPGVEIVWLPYIILVQFLLHTAISMVMGYICVFIRDVENILSYFMRVMRYASPVIWEASRLPPRYNWITESNPFSHLLNAYRNVLMYNKLPNFRQLTALGLVSLVIIVFMFIFYNKNEHKIIKVL